MPSVALIILNWNSPGDTISCAASLLQDGAFPTDIIIVDNASTDDSISQLEKYISTRKDANIFLIKNDKNAGFAGGINSGIQYALNKSYSYIGTLNPDATADVYWLTALVDSLEKDRSSGIATGLLLDRTGKKIDSSGEFFSIWGLPGPRNRGQPTSQAPTSREYVFGATGGGVLYRASLFIDIGIFDTSFFMYFEDVDLSFRAQLSGHRVVFEPKAIAYHNQGASARKVPGLAVYNTFKNLPILFIKNVPLPLWPSTYPRFILLYFLILGNAVIKGMGNPAIHGFLKSWVYLPHVFSERRRIQKRRKVSNAYIDSIMLHDIPPEQSGMRKFRHFFIGK